MVRNTHLGVLFGMSEEESEIKCGGGSLDGENMTSARFFFDI